MGETGLEQVKIIKQLENMNNPFLGTIEEVLLWLQLFLNTNVYT